MKYKYFKNKKSNHKVALFIYISIIRIKIIQSVVIEKVKDVKTVVTINIKRMGLKNHPECTKLINNCG